MKRNLKNTSLLIFLLTIISFNANARDLNALQKDFLTWKFGMFIHFNMSTFVPGGWATGKEDPLKFNPENLDIGQWADAAKSANMKYGILTVKHTGGWCLWRSETTDHDVSAFKNYKNGNGDIVKEFVDAFRSRGLKVGLYYCFPLWGDLWKGYMTLPSKEYTSGKLDALALIKAHFKELLTNYGEIDLVWIDQFGSNNGGLKNGDWKKVKEYIHQLQPNCLVIANTCKDYNNSDIYGYEYPYSLSLPKEGNTKVAEVCDKLNSGWFANPGAQAVPVRTADYIVNKMLLPLVNNNSNYLLNCSPEKTGKLHPETVKFLGEVGKLWDPNNTKKYDARLYGITQEAVVNIKNDSNYFALAFDESWPKEAREKAVTILKDKNATATFFISKSTAEKEKSSLRELIKYGHSLGNASFNAKDISKVSSMKISEFITPIQNQLLGIQAPVFVRFPEKQYSWDLWTALNYYQLLIAEPEYIVDSLKSIDTITKQAIPGNTAIIMYSDNAITLLENLLDSLNGKGLKVVSWRDALKKANSERLRSYVLNVGGTVVSGRE